MGDAQRGDEAHAYFAAELGPTRKIDVTDVAAQLPSVEGALPEGRYLIFVDELSAPGKHTVWVRVGKFGDTIPVTVGVPNFPLSRSGMMGIEFNARKNHSDQIAAITESGKTATLYITKVSRV